VHRGGFHGAVDLYSLTPYAAHPDSYVRTKQQLPAAGGLWRAALYPDAIAAMHFKWHSGVIQRCSAWPLMLQTCIAVHCSKWTLYMLS
jgi:hypothetical protein